MAQGDLACRRAQARLAVVLPAIQHLEFGGAYIGAAYFFTSSSSFANPAITIGRMFTDTFAGISPASALPFIGAQIVGAALGWIAVRVLFPIEGARVTVEA